MKLQASTSRRNGFPATPAPQIKTSQPAAPVKIGRSRAGVLLTALALWAASAAPAQAWLVERVNVSNAGAQAGSVTSSEAPSLSYDGRFVVFSSSASNLVEGDTNGLRDVFVRDRKLGTTVRASVDSAGNQITDFGTTDARISGNGRFVAFTSKSSILSPGANGIYQVYVRDLQDGVTTIVSRGTDGTPADQHSAYFGYPSLSQDGRFVVFSSKATNLVAGVSPSVNQIFVHDRSNGQTALVSKTGTGGTANGTCDYPLISGDGRYVVFESAATNLVTGVSGTRIYRHDRETGTTLLISVTAAGVVSDYPCAHPSISRDGRYVVFHTIARNLYDGMSPTNSTYHVYLKDATEGTLTLISKSAEGVLGNGHSNYANISPDGRYVSFVSAAQNLLADNSSIFTGRNAFLYDRTGQTLDVVNRTPAGAKPSAEVSYSNDVAENGRVVAFYSGATNLVTGDTNSSSDVFVSTRTTDGWTISPKSQLGGYRDDLAVAGNIAALIEGMSVSLWNLSSDTPAKLATLGLSHEPVRVAIAGNRVYVIGSLFSVVDIANPAAPVILGECAAEAPYWGGGLFAHGNYVYHTASAGSDIEVIDVSDPAHPAIVETLGIPAFGFTIAGGRLYAVSGSKFWVYNLASPLSPYLEGEYSASLIYSNQPSLYVDGTRVFNAAQYNGVQIFDVSSPTLPVKLSNFTTSGALYARDVYAAGNTMYLVTGSKALAVDITNAQVPVFLGETAIDGAWRVKGSGGAAYVMSMNDMAIQKIGLSGGQPVVNALAGTPSWASGNSLADAGRLYLGTGDQLWILDIVDPANPQVLGRDNRWTNFSSIAVRENRLYGMSGTKLYVIDVTNPASLSPVSEYTTGGTTKAGLLSGTTVYLTLDTNNDWKNDAVEVVNVSTPASPVKAGSTITFTDEIHGVAAAGNLLGIAGTDASSVNLVNVYDVTAPASPVLKSTINTPGDNQKIWLSGTTLFAASYDGSQTFIEAFDLTNSEVPARAGRTTASKQAFDIQVVTPAGKDAIIVSAVPGGSIVTQGYNSASGGFYPGPECHSPYSHQMTITPSASGSNYTVVANDESFGSFIQQIALPQTKCCLTTVVSPPLAAAEGCTATPIREDPVTCGGTVEVTATAKDPWVFKEWSGAATGTSATTQATATGDCSMATANFVKPILTLSAGGANPAGVEVYALADEFAYTQGRMNVPIAQIVLSANEDDDWLVTSMGFDTSGTGKENEDILQVRLLLGGAEGTVMGTHTFGADNQSLAFAMSLTIPKASSRTLTLVYDFKPEKAFPCNDYSAKTTMGKIVAIPINFPPGVKLPVPPAGVTGGPTAIKQGRLTIDPETGNNQYGEVIDPKKPGDPNPLPNPLRVHLGWQHPASVQHIDYQFNPPAHTFGGFLAKTHGTSSEQTVEDTGYAQESATLGTKKGKQNPYLIQATAHHASTTCTYSEATAVFTAWGLGAELGTTSQYDNPANGNNFGTFISDIQAENKFTLDIDMTPGYAEVISVVFSLGGQNVTATEVTHNAKYEATFDMAAFQKTEKLLVTVTMTKDGSQIEQTAEYDVKCLKLPTWVGAVAGICHPDSFVREFDNGAYKFTFNYPTNFAWSDYVPGDVGLLGGLKNDLDIEFSANAAYKVDETSTFGATIKGKPTILGREFSLEGGLSGDFDPSFAFQRGNGTLRASFGFDLPEKSFSKTFMVGYVPVTAAVDLSGNVEIFIRGSAVLNRQLEFEEITVAPGTTVTGNVTISLAAVFGLAKIAATGSPTATIEIEVKYTSASGTTTKWHGELVVPIKVVGSIFWGLGSAELCSTQLGPWSFPAGASGASLPRAYRPLGAVGGPPAPRLMSTSALAADGQGKKMSLWIDDRTPEAGTPDPDVCFRYFNGTGWTDSAPLIGATSTNAEWETDPAVVFMGGGAALGCWTANKGAKTLTNLNDILASQDIACSVWNGTAWSDPARIIDDGEADGTITLAYDSANNKAVAVWVHNADQNKQAMQSTAWQLRYSLFDPAAESGAGAFTAPAIVPGTDTGKADQMPAIAADGSGNTVLVWASDDDGQFYTENATNGDGEPTVINGTNIASQDNLDSHILWSRLTSQGWTAPAAIATGGTATKLSPSIAFSPGGAALAVWTEKEGGQKSLKWATLASGAGSWSASALVTQSEQFIEDPKAIVDATGKATVIWRAYAKEGKGNGALYASTGAMPNPVWSEPQQITHDDTIQWQPTVALDQNNRVVTSWSGYNMATGASQSGSGFGSGINVAETDPQSAALTDTYTGQVVDADNNGIYEALQVSVGANIARTGNYEVRADLYSGSRLVASVRRVRNGLAMGSQTFALVFDGAIIGDRGYDGPYSLRNVVVVDLNGSPVQTAFAAAPTFATEPYEAARFVRGPLVLDKTHYVGTAEQAVITLTDPLLNTDTGTVQTVAVRAASTRDAEGIAVILTETGANTGIFQGTCGFSLIASSASPGRILVADHDLIQVILDDAARDYKWIKTATWTIGGAGDVNGDGTLSLADAILVLKVGAGIAPANAPAMKEADVNADGKIGLDEALYILQYTAGLR